MADIPQPQPPLPPGAPGAPVTPMKKSTGKVQPKKETVRITLPPKPSAAPTIKLPTLPPAGPTGAPGGIPQAAPPKPAGTAAPVAAQRTTTAAPLSPGAAVAAAHAQAARPAPAQRAPAAAAPAASPLDTILAIAACVTALVAIGSSVWMMLVLNDAINN